MDCDNSKSLIVDVAILCDVLKTAILSDFLGINIGHIWNNNGFPMLPGRNVFKLLGLDTQMTGTLFQSFRQANHQAVLFCRCLKNTMFTYPLVI